MDRFMRGVAILCVILVFFYFLPAYVLQAFTPSGEMGPLDYAADVLRGGERGVNVCEAANADAMRSAAVHVKAGEYRAGFGVAIGDYVVTAAHVVAGEEAIAVSAGTIVHERRLSDWIPYRIVFVDSEMDFAILAPLGADRVPYSLSADGIAHRTSQLVGVCYMGIVQEAQRGSVFDKETFELGSKLIWSAQDPGGVHVGEVISFRSTTLNHGTSGSPLYVQSGSAAKLIGLVVSGIPGELGYAIPITPICERAAAAGINLCR